jgi:hypothetical protein
MLKGLGEQNAQFFKANNALLTDSPYVSDHEEQLWEHEMSNKCVSIVNHFEESNADSYASE